MISANQSSRKLHGFFRFDSYAGPPTSYSSRFASKRISCERPGGRMGNAATRDRYSNSQQNASQNPATNLLPPAQAQKLLPLVAANFEDPRLGNLRPQYSNNANGYNANPRRPNYPYRNNGNQYANNAN
ncbi:hypothetical protein AJ78_08671 [Emergomyces pasteurianus Ep9510]|uniref:Uncharacterized protein n=1 Tax=Emergomyces pasteurianus Ep9510 TaxID=1447872 RepID=A0A1J9P0A0_9EURO|nr:hypothetical protein AJ78_08671 [Emergomyces pasteurianus Ep9510]